jgi:hypothetical protein
VSFRAPCARWQRKRCKRHGKCSRHESTGQAWRVGCLESFSAGDAVPSHTAILRAHECRGRCRPLEPEVLRTGRSRSTRSAICCRSRWQGGRQRQTWLLTFEFDLLNVSGCVKQSARVFGQQAAPLRNLTFAGHPADESHLPPQRRPWASCWNASID